MVIDGKQENTNNILDIYNINDQMVKIPEGQIILRDDRINQSWEVKIQPFYLCKFPVTQELHSAITGKSSFSFPGDKNPVENVSWNEAIQFCNLLSKKEDLTEYYSINDNIVICNTDSTGYRLPTEAEWQYACKAGSTEVRYSEIDKIAWYKDNSKGTTHQVGTKEPNNWGLYDMLGNVWEWCWDIYDAKVYGEYRVIRGGGWFDPERGCLATNRRRSHPTFSIDDLGFRLAKNLNKN